MKELYNKKINERSIFKYFLGLLSRIRLYLKYGLIRMYARIRGAYIGRNSIITWKLACRANKNLVIGNDCIVESWNIDLRSKVEICDNDKSFTTRFYPDLKIEMYCWLCTGCIILPSVNTIAEGSVVGAYSVLTKSTIPMGVYAGNPAILKRLHNTNFEDLVVSSLMGGDLFYYVKAKNLN